MAWYKVKDWYELTCTVTAWAGLFAIACAFATIGGLCLLGLYAAARATFS